MRKYPLKVYLLTGLFFGEQVFCQLVKFNNKFGIMLPGTRAVKAGVDLADVTFFIDDDRSWKTFKVGQCR